MITIHHSHIPNTWQLLYLTANDTHARAQQMQIKCTQIEHTAENTSSKTTAVHTATAGDK